MAKRQTGLGPILLTVLLDLLGFGLVIPLISFYSEDYGATEIGAIALMGMYSVAQFVFAPFWGSLSDRIGRRPVLLVSIGATALMLALFAAADPIARLLTTGDDVGPTVLVLLFVARFLHGAFAANISTAQAYVADITTPEERAKGMGLIGAAFGLGFTLGPWVGGELSVYGHAVPIALAAGLSAINWVWALVGLPEPERLSTGGPRRSLDVARIVSGVLHPTVGALIALTFAGTLAFSMMEYSFPLAAEHRWGLREADIGRVFGLIGIVGIVIQGGLIRVLVKRFGEGPLVSVGFAVNAVGLALLPVVMPWGGLLAAAFLLAVGSSLLNPSMNALVSKGVAADEQGWILGINQSLGALARAVAPWLAMALYAGWFRGGAFVGAAVLAAVGFAASFVAVRRALAGSPEATGDEATGDEATAGV